MARELHDMHFKSRDASRALLAFEAVRAAGLARGVKVENMIGPAQGRAPQTIEIEGEEPIEIPGAGDPAWWYASIRSEISPEDLAAAGVNLAAYGIEPATAEECGAVVGVWV